MELFSCLQTSFIGHQAQQVVLVLSDVQESFLSPAQSVLLYQRCRLLLACLQYNNQLSQHLRSHFSEEFRFELSTRPSFTLLSLFSRLFSRVRMRQFFPFQVLCEAIVCCGEAAASLPNQPTNSATSWTDPEAAQMISDKHTRSSTWRKDWQCGLYWNLLYTKLLLINVQQIVPASLFLLLK